MEGQYQVECAVCSRLCPRPQELCTEGKNDLSLTHTRTHTHTHTHTQKGRVKSTVKPIMLCVLATRDLAHVKDRYTCRTVRFIFIDTVLDQLCVFFALGMEACTLMMLIISTTSISLLSMLCLPHECERCTHYVLWRQAIMNTNALCISPISASHIDT